MAISRIFTGALVKCASGKAMPVKYVREFNLIPFNRMSKVDADIAESCGKVFLTQLEIAPKATKGMGEIVFGSGRMAAKKEKLLQFANEIGDKKLSKQISKTNNTDELYNICSDYCIGLLKRAEPEIKKLLSRTNGRTTLELEQIAYKLKEDRANKLLKLYEAIGEKSTNPEVIKIERELAETYGMKSVNLQDDINKAREILNVVKNLKSKGYPIPKNTVVSDLHFSDGELVRLNGENTMILQSSRFLEKMHQSISSQEFVLELAKKAGHENFEKFQSKLMPLYNKGLGMLSTARPEHIVVHECLHANHPNLLAFLGAPLPAKSKAVIPKISIYSNVNCNRAEVLTELETELVLTGTLSPEKAELLNIFKDVKFNNVEIKPKKLTFTKSKISGISGIFDKK